MNDDGLIQSLRHVLEELKRHDTWLSSLDNKMDNHIVHIEHRLTAIETTLKNMKYILGLVISLVISIFIMVLKLFVEF